MIASSDNVIRAVWLDPFSPVEAADRAQLDASGISLETVSTLGDLALALRRCRLEQLLQHLRDFLRIGAIVKERRVHDPG